MTSPLSSVDLLQTADKAHVLCIGDIMLDRFIYGSVERISPEAPIPVIKIEREDTMLGGAGNVVRNLLSLNCQATFIGLTGQDEAGQSVQAILQENGHCTPHLIADAHRPTSVKTRYLASGQQMLRADQETIAPLNDEQCQELYDYAKSALANVQVMVLSDYGKGVLTENTIQTLISLAKAANVPVICDPKGTDYSKYRGATLVTPNRKELMEASHLPCSDDQSIIAAAKKLIETCGIENILATRSQDGMSLIEKSGKIVHLPTKAQEVFDVSGAGDTVVASLAMAMARGSDLEQAANLSNLAAGIVVGKIGTASVYNEELIDAFHHQDLSAAEAKILGWDSAQDRVKLWKSQGFTVGFTNGCFDLLHPGHISLLKQSRAQCDKLIVGLNADSSIKRLKGEERPIQGEMARATVLSSLACVDMVVLFGEDTPLELLEVLLPDVLVKGADYTVEQVVGATLIQENGGRVFLADLKDGFSTTNTVNKMKNNR